MNDTGSLPHAPPRDAAAARTARSRRWLLYAPLAAAGGAVLGFWALLRGLGTGRYDPRGVPSALIGQPVPDFALPPLEGAGLPGLSAADLRGGLERPALVNFWASWCVPCLVEHPLLMRLAREGTPVFGINYKDRPEDARAFLGRHGNPFARLGADQPGRVAIDWGVYGVPETYLVDRGGVIRWRWAGPLTPPLLESELRPLLRRHA
ncbi:DsbE family thiol:disulfide interchange protein [Caldovatus aquaticus]|uniref:DsbE family thiol:disulfide interchange protein n=1 Tax=Caldovatus aquaticus TaxID=2865671 RepID=A0ABS7F3Y5_9PROT|nr:DsbE family thiol:disulfide interchange protein [Caldovatus aquaticus]MBW8270318.1 DsbE family thiol:disulfide interchange protein [Caldovatus aquaticus]